MITIVGIDTFIEGLGVAKDTVQKRVERTLLDVALQMRRLAQGKAPKRTSVLAQSITAQPIAFGAMTSVGEKYGIYVEQGTGLYDPRGAHLIFPKTAQAMVWSEGGRKYGARWTRGMRPQPYFEPAFEATLPYLQEKLSLTTDEVLRIAAG